MSLASPAECRLQVVKGCCRARTVSVLKLTEREEHHCDLKHPGNHVGCVLFGVLNSLGGPHSTQSRFNRCLGTCSMAAFQRVPTKKGQGVVEVLAPLSLKFRIQLLEFVVNVIGHAWSLS